MMKQPAKQLLSLSVILFLILFLGATTQCPNPPSNANGVTTVAMRGLLFVPSTVTIQVGETVRWVNAEDTSVPAVTVSHTVTSGNPGEPTAGQIWDSPLVHPGESYERKFTEPGDFVYFCRVHPTTMRDAHVIVEGEGAPAEGEGDLEEGEEGEATE